MKRHKLSIKLAKDAGDYLLKNFHKYKPREADQKKIIVWSLSMINKPKK